MKCKKSSYKFIWVLAILIYGLGAVFNTVFSGFNTEGQVENSAGESIMAVVANLQQLGRYSTVLQLALFVLAAGVAFLIINACRKKRIGFGAKYLTDELRLMAGHLLTYGIIFVSYDKFDSMYQNYGIEGLNLSFVNKGVLFLFELLGLWIVRYLVQGGHKWLEKYFSGKAFVFLNILCIYVAYAAGGNALFLRSTEVAWSINLETLGIFVLLAYWVLPYILGFIAIWETKGIWAKRSQTPLTIKDKLLIVGIMVAIFIPFFIAAYPAIWTDDSPLGWIEVMCDTPYTKKHSPAVKLIWWLTYAVTGGVAAETVLQIAMWIWVVAAFIFFFTQKGMSKRAAVIIAVLTSALTPFNLYVMTHLSHYWYMIAILWVVYFVIRNNDDAAYAGRIVPMAGLGLALAGIYLFRNEGKVAYVIVAAILVIYYMVKRNWAYLVSIGISAVLAAFISGPVYSWAGVVDPTDMSDDSINMLVNDVTIATCYFGGELSEESVQTIEKYVTLDDMAAMYDEYGYDCEKDTKLRDFQNNDEEVRGVALDATLHNIPIAFRERLNKTENVLNIIEPYGAKQGLRSTGIVDNLLEITGRSDTLLYLITMKVMYYPTIMLMPLHILFYRSGIYLCLLLVLCLYWAVNGRKKRMLAALPAFAHCFVLLLSLVWPIARHTWVVILVTWIVMIYENYDDNAQEESA